MLQSRAPCRDPAPKKIISLGAQPGHAARRDRAHRLLLPRGPPGQHGYQQRGPRRLQRPRLETTQGNEETTEAGPEDKTLKLTVPAMSRIEDDEIPCTDGGRRGQAQEVRRHPPRRHRLPLAGRGERLHRRPPPRLPQHRELAHLLGHEQGRTWATRSTSPTPTARGTPTRSSRSSPSAPQTPPSPHPTRQEHPHPPDLHPPRLLPAPDHPGRAHGHLGEGGLGPQAPWTSALRRAADLGWRFSARTTENHLLYGFGEPRS